MQAWQHAAKLNGVAAEEFNNAFVKFNKNIAEAAEGAGPAKEAFDALGVSIKDSTGQLGEPIELLEGVASGIAAIEDPAKRTQVVMDLFGRSGAKLLPLFAEGPEGIRKLREEMKELGGGITQEFADASDELNDNLERMNVAVLSLKVRIAGFLVPAFTSAVEWLTRAFSAIRKVTQETNILQSAFVVFGSIAAVKVASLAASFAPLLLRLGKMGFWLALAVLTIDELITTFQGGDTIIRRIIDGWFGDGATARVVNWFKEIAGGLSQMRSDSLETNEQFRTTWEATLADIRDDFGGTFGPFFGGILAAAVDTFFVFVNSVSGGFDQFLSVGQAVIEGLFFSFQVVWDDIMSLTLGALARMSDAITATLNLASNIPGLGDLATDTKAPGYVSATDREKGRRQQAAGDRYAQALDIDRRLRGNVTAERKATEKANFVMPGTMGAGFGVLVDAPRSANIADSGGAAGGGFGRREGVSVTAPITVNVPPGTPAQQARHLAGAAQRGVNRAAAAGFERRGK
jgi:hypothetical protein